MSRRSHPAQGEPHDLDASFPARVPRRRIWFRAHGEREGSDRGCWFYASVQAGAGGRFDLPWPRGTCYLASTEYAAARERLGRPGRVVAREETVGVVVSRVRFAPSRVADLLHRDAGLHGVTRELCASTPYELAQRWARAFDAAGFRGLVYPPRFSTDAVEALAVFGPAGVPDPLPTPVESSTSMADALASGGCDVVGPPPLAALGPLVE